MTKHNQNPKLMQKTCVPCRGGIPPLPREAAEKLLNDVPDWTLTDDGHKIRRNYTFDNFLDALAFTNKVGEISEAENHHPDMTLGWGYCNVVFYSHKIGGLHENDFIMAAKTSALYQA